MMLEILRKKLNKMVALEYPAALSQTMDAWISPDISKNVKKNTIHSSNDLFSARWLILQFWYRKISCLSSSLSALVLRLIMIVSYDIYFLPSTYHHTPQF